VWRDSESQTYHVKYENDDPDTTYYLCVNGCVIEEESKTRMLERGQWIATNPTSKIPGFHISALYSPWLSWKEMVDQWLKKKGDPQTLKVFVNQFLGETFDESGERVESHHLAAHLDKYDAPVPSGVGVLTAGVDVQGDRIEVHVWGWGERKESWFIDRSVILSDPGKDETWTELAATLQTRYRTVGGGTVPVTRVAIDTGHMADHVFKFVRTAPRYGLTVIPVKGSSIPTARLWEKTKRVISVGTNDAKNIVASRLKTTVAGIPGPGFIHLPDNISLDMLDQLTAEKPFIEYIKGRKVKVWKNPKKERNEALDCLVYAMVALETMPAVSLLRLGTIAAKLKEQVDAIPPDPSIEIIPTDPEQDEDAVEAPPEPIIRPKEPIIKPPLRSRKRVKSGWNSGLHI
jgi:phage terminase large subunit GpA-like protein